MAPFDSAKLQHLMDEAGMDLVLASSRHNVRYLTGGYVYHFHEGDRPMGSSQYLAFAGVPRGASRTPSTVGATGEKNGRSRSCQCGSGSGTSTPATSRRPPPPPR